MYERAEFFDRLDISNCAGSGIDTRLPERSQRTGKFISQKAGHDGAPLPRGVSRTKQKSEDEENKASVGGKSTELGKDESGA